MQRFWSIVLVISGIAAIGFAAFGAFAAPNTAGTAALCFGLPGFLMILMGRRAHQRADFAEYARYMAERKPAPPAQFEGVKRVAPPLPPPEPNRTAPPPRSRSTSPLAIVGQALRLVLALGLVAIVIAVFGGVLGTSSQSSDTRSGRGEVQSVVTRQIRATATIMPRSNSRTETPVSASQAYRTTGNANVRSCAGTTCNVITTLPVNTLVEVTGDTVSGGATWYRVRLSDGRTGYMHSSTVRAGSHEFVAASSGSNPTQVPGGSQPHGRPRNCDEARAMGLPADVIARDYPDLDRDKDGYACYDD